MNSLIHNTGREWVKRKPIARLFEPIRTGVEIDDRSQRAMDDLKALPHLTEMLPANIPMIALGKVAPVSDHGFKVGELEPLECEGWKKVKSQIPKHYPSKWVQGEFEAMSGANGVLLCSNGEWCSNSFGTNGMPSGRYPSWLALKAALKLEK